MIFNVFGADSAFAQAAEAAAKSPSIVEMLAMPLGFLVIMYFMIILPQQKKAKEHAALLGGLKAGDEVVTTGGIIGKIRSVADSFVTIEVANNTAIKVLKQNVTGLAKEAVARPAKEASKEASQ
jgi:preprotein translocase subunit YajC